MTLTACLLLWALGASVMEITGLGALGLFWALLHAIFGQKD